MFQEFDVSNMDESALKIHMESEKHILEALAKHASVRNLFNVQKENTEPVLVEQSELESKSACLTSPDNK